MSLILFGIDLPLPEGFLYSVDNSFDACFDPISFAIPDSDPGGPESERDIGLRPLALIQSEGSVSLDSKGKMQCTTCHDPHSDRHYDPGRVPRFWVKPTVNEVCLACHELR